MAGETQENIAKIFGVAQSTLSEGWSKFRDRVHKLYVEERLLKHEVAEKVGLTPDEVDKVLQEYGDPLNFELMTSRALNFVYLKTPFRLGWGVCPP